MATPGTQANVTPPSNPTHTPTPTLQGQREVNCVSLCRLGQETVQDIVAKTNEIFVVLKSTQVETFNNRFAILGVKTRTKGMDSPNRQNWLKRIVRVLSFCAPF